jgi:tyrosinase
VQVHMNAMMASSSTDPRDDPSWYPGWAHNGPAFFPWHRQYILQFEKDLQSIDPSVTLPYWDWTAPATDKNSSPFTADFLGNDGESAPPDKPEDAGKVVDGPFAHDGPNHWTINVKDEPQDPDYLDRGFGRISGSERLPTVVQLQRAMSIIYYDGPVWKLGSPGFRTAAEVTLHNLVHRWVNGAMVRMTSPNDPVFWLHHANIDRLWGDWQRLHPEVCPYVPSGTGVAPAGHNLYDLLIFNDNMSSAPWPGPNTTPSALINHLSLGYSYDSDPKEIIESINKIPVARPKTTRSKQFLPPFPSMDQIV